MVTLAREGARTLNSVIVLVRWEEVSLSDHLAPQLPPPPPRLAPRLSQPLQPPPSLFGRRTTILVQTGGSSSFTTFVCFVTAADAAPLSWCKPEGPPPLPRSFASLPPLPHDYLGAERGVLLLHHVCLLCCCWHCRYTTILVWTGESSSFKRNGMEQIGHRFLQRYRAEPNGSPCLSCSGREGIRRFIFFLFCRWFERFFFF